MIPYVYCSSQSISSSSKSPNSSGHRKKEHDKIPEDGPANGENASAGKTVASVADVNILIPINLNYVYIT